MTALERQRAAAPGRSVTAMTEPVPPVQSPPAPRPPFAIEPDTKDWTWVLHEPCPECGFAAQRGRRAVRRRAGRAPPSRWQAVLARPEAAVPARAHDLVAAGVRLPRPRRLPGVHRAGRWMLRRDDPVFPNWDQDAAAVSGRYHVQDPALVAASCARPLTTLGRPSAAVEGDAVAAHRAAQQRLGVHHRDPGPVLPPRRGPPPRGRRCLRRGLGIPACMPRALSARSPQAPLLHGPRGPGSSGRGGRDEAEQDHEEQRRRRGPARRRAPEHHAASSTRPMFTTTRSPKPRTLFVPRPPRATPRLMAALTTTRTAMPTNSPVGGLQPRQHLPVDHADQPDQAHLLDGRRRTAAGRARPARRRARRRCPSPPAAGRPRCAVTSPVPRAAAGRRTRTPAATASRHDDRRPEPGHVGQRVGEVELGDVDPPLLRQLDEDPDRRRRRRPRTAGSSGTGPSAAGPPRRR